MMRKLTWRTKQAWGDRGATMVEYALIVALIVVVSLGAIQRVQTRGEEKLDASDARISVSSDGQYYAGGVTPSSAPGSSTTSTPASSVHLGSSPTVVVQDAGNKWTVTVTFTLLDGSNNGVIGARLDAAFADGPGNPTAVNCTTSTSSGLCTVQFLGINDNKSPVTLTVTKISGGGFSWTPQSPGEGNLTIACSPPLSSSCN